MRSLCTIKVGILDKGRGKNHPLLILITRYIAGSALPLSPLALDTSWLANDCVNGHILYVDGGILATIGKPSNE